jgi:hypothetical protein
MARRRGGSPVKSGARSASTHASWLNQVEIWFSILAFQAVEELRTHIDAFINDHNETARPFAWTKSKVHQKHLKPCVTD